jgi:hypothetical protein
MDKLKLLAVAALALIWHLLPVSTPLTATQGEGVRRVSAAAVPAPTGQPAAVPIEAAATTMPLKAQALAENEASTPSTSTHNLKIVPDLTRALEHVQSVKMAGRAWSILGASDVVNDHGKQVVLVLRDEISGQLVYRQSALRVVLRQVVDYEAFIGALPNATLLFVNPLYGEIGVDAAKIGAQYSALASDPRVLRVNFIPLEMPVRA